MSKSGGGAGALRPVPVRLGLGGLAAPLESTDVVDELIPAWSFSRSKAVDARGVPEGKLMLGNTSRFCFDGGRISSRSTGTPRDTRNSRRIRDRVQLGGCIGGGETSCCHSESERSDRKGEVLDGSIGGRSLIGVTGSELGNRALM